MPRSAHVLYSIYLVTKLAVNLGNVDQTPLIYLTLHLLHIISNSMQSLCDLSHLVIITMPL